MLAPGSGRCSAEPDGPCGRWGSSAPACRSSGRAPSAQGPGIEHRARRAASWPTGLCAPGTTRRSSRCRSPSSRSISASSSAMRSSQYARWTRRTTLVSARSSPRSDPYLKYCPDPPKRPRAGSAALQLALGEVVEDPVGGAAQQRKSRQVGDLVLVRLNVQVEVLQLQPVRLDLAVQRGALALGGLQFAQALIQRVQAVGVGVVRRPGGERVDLLVACSVAVTSSGCRGRGRSPARAGSTRHRRTGCRSCRPAGARTRRCRRCGQLSARSSCCGSELLRGADRSRGPLGVPVCGAARLPETRQRTDGFLNEISEVRATLPRPHQSGAVRGRAARRAQHAQGRCPTAP